MRRFIPIALLLGLFVGVASLSAKDDQQPKYKTAEVKHFSMADGVNVSQNVLNYAYDQLRESLQKKQLFVAVVGDGGMVDDADAADSVIVECKVTYYRRLAATGHVDITIFRRSDHTVLQHLTATVDTNGGTEKARGKQIGWPVADKINKVLK